MPILPPSLDDRNFDDLVEELLARIPAHTPEWTNPRLGDPGRTLIELFAWLADTLLYRANLIPLRQRLVFLKLLGTGLRPAQPARGILSLSFAKDTETVPAELAAGAVVRGPVAFETLSEAAVLPVSAEVYYKRPLTGGEQQRLTDVVHGLEQVYRLSRSARPYVTTPVFEGGADRNGFDFVARSVDRALWIALLAPKADRPEEQAAVNEQVGKALGTSVSGAARLLNIGIVPALKLPALFEEVGPRARVPAVWEIVTAGDRPNTVDYLTLSALPEHDTSQGLTRPGVLRLPLPAQEFIHVPDNDVARNPNAGVGDVPPRVDDDAKAARIVAWLRLRPESGQPLENLALSWVGINAVEVDQRQTVAGRVLGVSTGAADQVFSLPATSVDPESLRIEVEEPGRGYQPWARVEDLATINRDPTRARDARVYALDAEAGTIRFGDGVRGRVPEREMRARLAFGRFGGGRAGNLPAGTLVEVSGRLVDERPAPPLKALQPLPTAGGEDAETIEQAEKRIPAQFRHKDRAVTGEDFRRLAQEAPGVDVGRVEVLPRFKPRERRFDVPGVVSVMALPRQALSGPPNPRPDRPFIERLHAFLSARRPLGTELYVIGSEYVPVGVSVAVTIREGFGRDTVLHAVREALKRLLWPLPPGGFAGEGWPLGRPLRDGELEVEVSRVPGVASVAGPNLFTRGDNNEWRLLPRDPVNASQELALREWQLPELLSVVAVEGAAPPDNLRAVPNPFAEREAIAVPVVPEVC